jgi:RNase adaptor protein for sRNA GlmZ degradation
MPLRKMYKKMTTPSLVAWWPDTVTDPPVSAAAPLRIVSFRWRFGIPDEPLTPGRRVLVVDACRDFRSVRHLPACKHLDGTNTLVQAALMACEMTERHVYRIVHEVRAGRLHGVPYDVAIGSGFGRHRAPAIAHIVRDLLRNAGLGPIEIIHRDLPARPVVALSSAVTVDTGEEGSHVYA